MKAYADFLQDQGFSIKYVESSDAHNLNDLFELLVNYGIEELHLIWPDDYLIHRRLQRYSNTHNIRLKFFDNPSFILNKEELDNYIEGKSSFFMGSFYKNQRKSLDILMKDGEPVGGKWSFDEDNRKKLPRNIELPEIGKSTNTTYLEEALEYIEKQFGDNPGHASNFIYPVTFSQARDWLKKFLNQRLSKFGDYEDAISADDNYLFHAILSPSLNIGLITPELIIEDTLKFASENDVPLNSLEGFIRQIIGWREYMRIVYHARGVHQRTNNHFNHSRKIPDSFYTGTTGVEPIDNTIRKLLDTSYNHHIERLMILGNFMLLCEFDPDEIYRWFMELYIDAYDWVMVSNVYAMSQYADNGEITTKPYISGSNYVRKMSNYSSGPWCDIWDGLYWRFLFCHKDEFKSNPRMSMIIRMLEKMDPDKLETHLTNADNFLDSLS